MYIDASIIFQQTTVAKCSTIIKSSNVENTHSISAIYNCERVSYSSTFLIEVYMNLGRM
jgi:hypothetical protein